MRRRILFACLSSLLVFTVFWTDVNAQTLFSYSGTFVRRKLARTQTAGSQISAANAWVTVPGAILSYAVPSGTSDLFNVSFSAECAKILGGAARIRVIDTVSGVVFALRPYDGGQAFCSSASVATYTGTWVRRLGAGTHTLQVQINQTGGVTAIDDWTFELVVYD